MKNILSIILFICVSFVFFGCSSTTVNTPDKINIIDSDVDISDEFEDFEDFEDESELNPVNDPFISYNRTMTGFNDGVYENVFTPVNNGYKFITTEGIRESVGNFFNNIYFPMHLLNNLFQGKINGALVESGRFLINTTIGLLGLFDPAKSQFDLYPHKEDFGQTLGFYGVGAGPHIVLPIFGPSNLRDLVSIIPDAALSPVDYTSRSWWTITDTWAGYLTFKTVEQFNKLSIGSSQYEIFRKDAVDLYPYMRDIYEQKRNQEIAE